MTPAVMDYVRATLAARAEIAGPVLEVGSYDVNGSVRPLFRNRVRFPDYIGVDLQAGPAVDFVMPASRLHPEWESSFGVVVSTEMLEHDECFWSSMKEFHRVLNPGGHVILTTRNIGFPRHDFPSDYWRFTSDGLRKLMEWGGFRVIESLDTEEGTGTFGLGIRD